MLIGAKGKMSCAFPAQEQTAEEGSGEKDKLLVKGNSVASSIKSLKPSSKNTADCSSPDNILLVQRKILQLEKQFRSFEVYTADPKNQLLLSDNPSMNDACVISYDSKGPVQDLNGEAKNRTDGSPIVCRHLAYAFATGGFGVKTNVNRSGPKEPGGKFNAVASIDNIRNNAAIKTDQQLDNTPISCGIPKVAVYFDAEHFGQAMYDVWMKKGVGDQASQGKPSQAWLLETGNHVMAIKLVSTVESAIKIEFYNPNYTTIVRRVIVSNEEILQQLTLNQFVSMLDQECYAFDQGQAAVLMSTDAVEAENDSVVTILAALTPSLLNLLMLHGQLNSSSMDSLKMTLSKLGSDNSRKLIELLAAKTETGVPSLYLALENGHQEAVKAYLEIIKQFRNVIEPRVIWKLFSAKRKDGLTGLCMALQEGHQEAISAYFEGIKQFRDIIEPRVIWKLFAAKIENGTPGLCMALQEGHQEAISAYFEGIKQFQDIIEPRVIWKLFAAKRKDGLPGLCMALQEGHQEAISAYFEGVKQFRDIIEPGAIWKLLAAKIRDGTPGLFMALQNGHQGAIGAYFEGIKQFRDIIEPGVIWKLLAAKMGNGTLGLYMAQLNGHQEAIRAYVEGINQIKDIIEPEFLNKLLAANKGNPESATSRLRNKPEKRTAQCFLCTIL